MPTMYAFSSLGKVFTVRQIFKKSAPTLNCPNKPAKGTYTEKTNKSGVKEKKHVVQGTENEDCLRVRRARPADVPRVLRFVREHSTTAWPGLVAPPSDSPLVLCDYVSRALAQGHSMLAELQESRRGWSQIRGLALGLATCPWDATILERWARCVRCTRSRSFLNFTAYCLRAPALHDKYGAHNILQIIVIVPQNCPKNTEIIDVLAKNVIQRGRDVGFPVMRFDVTDNIVAKALEVLNLKKEWQLSYDLLPNTLKERLVENNIGHAAPCDDADKSKTTDPTSEARVSSIVVYSSVNNRKSDKI